LAGAIVLETLALVVWNIGTRSPAALVRDVRRSATSARAVLMGFTSFLVGVIFAIAATILLLPAVPDKLEQLVPVEIFTFVVALGIEYLIGNDLRAPLSRS